MSAPTVSASTVSATAVSAPTLPSPTRTALLSHPDVAVAGRVASLSTAAPYALPHNTSAGQLIRLFSGAPAPEALPLEDLSRIAGELLADPATGAAALAYGPHAGLPALRDWIAAREEVDVASVLITNGALHGVALAFAALIDPGDVVVLDDPVFPDTVRIAEQYGGRVLPVRVGPAGIDVGRIADHLAAGVPIKVVYTVPDFHNPSGAVLSADSRRRLVELAERYGFVIVSDNPYRDTTFDGCSVEDFQSDSGRVLRVGSFTKTLGAGLRLGWASGPAWLVPHLENVRRRSDFHSNALGQSIIQRLLAAPGWFDAVLARNRQVHSEKARVFTDSLRDRTGNLLEFTAPRGGFFVWARLTEAASTADRLVSAAARRQLLITSGAHFAADGGPQWDRHLRFAFSGASLQELPLAVDRLVDALADAR